MSGLRPYGENLVSKIYLSTLTPPLVPVTAVYFNVVVLVLLVLCVVWSWFFKVVLRFLSSLASLKKREPTPLIGLLNPYKPSVLFMVYPQTAQNKTRRRRSRRLIRFAYWMF